MSSNVPDFPYDTASSQSSRATGPDDDGSFSADPGPMTREWAISFVLLCLTLVTTSFAGLFYAIGDVGFLNALRIVLLKPGLILWGISFSFPLVCILLAHELGHFFACRHYGMRCTPPFFIPMPVPLTGTLGAFIKIKSAFRNKRALFDIGIAGPLAGFLFALPVLWIGISLSKLIPKIPAGSHALSFGEPLLFRLIGVLALGYSPDKQDLMVHPMAMAGWVGLLATSLNLLPIWQLDGGHIAYAVFGRERQRRLSIVFVVALILLSFWGWPTPSYLLFGLLLLIIGMRLRFYHPSTLNDDEPLGPLRLLLGGAAFVILVLCFTPVPVSFM